MPIGKKPMTPAEDPAEAFSRLQRETSAVARGVNVDEAELGDTVHTMAAAEQAGADESPSNEILDLVTASLAADPERADLWMMRFDIQKTLGMKAEFADSLAEGWAHPRLGRKLDWVLISQMWELLAPGEPAPNGIKLPSPGKLPAAETPPAAGGATVKPAGQKRRFSDTALAMAPGELTVLGKAYAALRARPDFLDRYHQRLDPVIRRPSPLSFASNITRNWGTGASIYFKREDQRSVTAEAEYAMAQAWLALQLGRGAVVTGNDVDGHSQGLAVAAKHLQVQCTIVVRTAELEKRKDWIARLRALGATVEAPRDAKLADADPRVAALQRWQQDKGRSHLALSLGWGPAPYPTMVNDFQSLLGREAEGQIRATERGSDPLTLVSSVGSESDAIGFMLPQLNDDAVELVLAEPEPGGVASWRPSKRMSSYNGSRREHCWLHATGRITHVAIADSQALAMQQQAGSLEGVQLSFEDARALALASLLARRSGEARNYVVLAG